MNLKEKPSSQWIIIISVSCLGILLNCISFVKYENPSLKNTPTPELQEKKTILVKYFGDYYDHGKLTKRPQSIPVFEETMSDILKDSNLFKNVVTDENATYDLIMYVETDIDDKSNLPLAAISGLTFLLFPLYIDLDLNMKVSLLDSKKKVLAVNEERLCIDNFFGFLMIPATPFFASPVVEKKAYRNIIYSSLRKWESKGVIK